MRRPYAALAIIAAVAALGYWAMAADMTEPKAAMPGMDMTKRCMMGGGMCPGHGMMGKMMGDCQMVATSDGGVIVKMGTTLMKYDKDLTMVKEVAMKVDTDAMMKKMTDMCAKCPMCMKMTDDKKTGAGN